MGLGCTDGVYSRAGKLNDSGFHSRAKMMKALSVPKKRSLPEDTIKWQASKRFPWGVTVVLQTHNKLYPSSG